MSNKRKKKVIFLAVTNEYGSENRVCSDYIFNQCKSALTYDPDISKEYDIEQFHRHDMLNNSALEKSILNLLNIADHYIILLDCYNGNYSPNVWFELGVLAITSNKPMILISQENNTNHPFYIRNQANVLPFPMVI